MKNKVKRSLVTAIVLGMFAFPVGASAGVEWCCSPAGVDRASEMGVLPAAPNHAGHVATPNWNPPNK